VITSLTTSYLAQTILSHWTRRGSAFSTTRTRPLTGGLLVVMKFPRQLSDELSCSVAPSRVLLCVMVWPIIGCFPANFAVSTGFDRSAGQLIPRQESVPSRGASGSTAHAAAIVLDSDHWNSYSRGMKKQKPRPVDEMREEVARLRNEGLSFSQVAKELGISKSYAVKLSKPQSDRSPQPVHGHLGLSVRQRKFAKGLLECKTQKQAALDANVPPASAETWASKEVRNPKFLSEFHKILDLKGLSEEKLAQIHVENLEATKTIVATHDGKITDQLKVPDYPARQRAVDSGWDLYQRRKPAEVEQPYVPQPIIINLEKKALIEGLIGGPLEGPNIKVIDVLPQESDQAAPTAPKD